MVSKELMREEDKGGAGGRSGGGRKGMIVVRERE